MAESFGRLPELSRQLLQIERPLKGCFTGDIDMDIDTNYLGSILGPPKAVAAGQKTASVEFVEPSVTELSIQGLAKEEQKKRQTGLGHIRMASNQGPE